MYLIESMMPSSLNVCTNLILFSRAWTGDSSYLSTLLIKVPGTLLPVTMYCFSNSIHKSFAGPGTRHMSCSKVTVFCLRISPTLGTLIALRSEELCDLLPMPTQPFKSVPCSDSRRLLSFVVRSRHSSPYDRVGEHMVRHRWLFTSGLTLGLLIPISPRPKKARRHLMIRSSTWEVAERFAWNRIPKTSMCCTVSMGSLFRYHFSCSRCSCLSTTMHLVLLTPNLNLHFDAYSAHLSMRRCSPGIVPLSSVMSSA